MRTSGSSKEVWRAGISCRVSLRKKVMTPNWNTGLLNFLGPVGRKKHEQWTPDGATPVICAKTKKSATEFMKFLHAGMDHPVSQRCRIYQLEEIRIKAGETPDELVDRIRGLADRCNFPTDAEKE